MLKQPFVTPTGLEPVTRTLKVCCATNCATESTTDYFFISTNIKNKNAEVILNLYYN